MGSFWDMAVGASIFFIISVEGNSDFGGLLAKETLPGFGFLGYVC